MDYRRRSVDIFLQHAGWDGAKRAPLAEDASFRRYFRLFHPNGETAMLMDAPPPQEDVRPFIKIAECLLELSFSAPRILHADIEQGFLLLEDFGDATYTQLLANDGNESELYLLATDTLIDLHRGFSGGDGIPPYDDDRLLNEAALLVDWFLPAIRGGETAPATRNAYLDLWKSVLPLARNVPETLVLRDYHVDNLMHLPGRLGTAACGLLDFQDAVIGPVTYDLVSLLEDARRDVTPDIASRCFDRYMDAFPNLDADTVRASYAILGAQRSAKIIGIFTRLDRRDGKPGYLEHIPRVFRWLERDLQHSALESIRTWLDHEVPPAMRATPSKSPQ
tara:strand:+ start:1378 stop:2382 length:1005 start_codon:yes stop_codon:yes gene_type:complete